MTIELFERSKKSRTLGAVSPSVEPTSLNGPWVYFTSLTLNSQVSEAFSELPHSPRPETARIFLERAGLSSGDYINAKPRTISLVYSPRHSRLDEVKRVLTQEQPSIVTIRTGKGNAYNHFRDEISPSIEEFGYETYKIKVIYDKAKGLLKGKSSGHDLEGESRICLHPTGRFGNKTRLEARLNMRPGSPHFIPLVNWLEDANGLYAGKPAAGARLNKCFLN